VVLGVGSGFYPSLHAAGSSRSWPCATSDLHEHEKGMMTMKSMISARGLAKRYQLGKNNYVDALQDVAVEIVEGEMVAIMGPSGCGKSTLLHVLGAWTMPTPARCG